MLVSLFRTDILKQTLLSVFTSLTSEGCSHANRLTIECLYVYQYYLTPTHLVGTLSTVIYMQSIMDLVYDNSVTEMLPVSTCYQLIGLSIAI